MKWGEKALYHWQTAHVKWGENSVYPWQLVHVWNGPGGIWRWVGSSWGVVGSGLGSVTQLVNHLGWTSTYTATGQDVQTI